MTNASEAAMSETSFIHEGPCEDVEHPEGFQPPNKVRLRLTEEECERVIRWYLRVQDLGEQQRGDLTLAAKFSSVVDKLHTEADHVSHGSLLGNLRN